MRVGILGGTGPAGSGLGARLASCGFEVVIGSRSEDRAADVCKSILEKWPGRDLSLSGGDNSKAAAADLVIVATPWDAAASTAGAVGDLLDGKVIISMANALARVGNEFQPLITPRGSIAGAVQERVGGARVAAAFHHFAARSLADLDTQLDGDVLICSDHAEATRATLELVGAIPGLRGLDAGPLASAGTLEGFVAILVEVNRRYKARAALRLTGVET